MPSRRQAPKPSLGKRTSPNDPENTSRAASTSKVQPPVALALPRERAFPIPLSRHAGWLSPLPRSPGPLPTPPRSKVAGKTSRTSSSSWDGDLLMVAGQRASSAAVTTFRCRYANGERLPSGRGPAFSTLQRPHVTTPSRRPFLHRLLPPTTQKTWLPLEGGRTVTWLFARISSSRRMRMASTAHVQWLFHSYWVKRLCWHSH